MCILIGQIISIRKVVRAYWNLPGKHAMKWAIETMLLSQALLRHLKKLLNICPCHASYSE